jgi:hypothetical protein
LPTVDSPQPEPKAWKTSGVAHVQLAPLEHAVLDARCGAEVTLPSDGTAGLVEDDAQGADVTCRYDAKHFEAALYGDMGGLEVRGTFDGIGGARSVDAEVRIDLPGARYQSTVACTVTFDGESGGVLSGSFACPDIESRGAVSACAVKGDADASGKPVSFFRFSGCTSL